MAFLYSECPYLNVYENLTNASKIFVFADFLKKAQYSDIRAEEVRHFLRRVSRLVSSHERTLAEARRTKLFAFLLSSVKSENLSASNPPSVRRTFTALNELFRHLFVSLHLHRKN